jgi:hypothetical protein
MEAATGNIEISMAITVAETEIVEAITGIKIIIIVIVVIVAAWDGRIVPCAVGGRAGVIVVVCLLGMDRPGKTARPANKVTNITTGKSLALMLVLQYFVFYIN